MRFRSTVELGGRTATCIAVSPDVVAGLGGRRPPVRVAITGHTYRWVPAARAAFGALSSSNQRRHVLSVEVESSASIGEVVVACWPGRPLTPAGSPW